MNSEILLNYAVDKLRRFLPSPFNRLSHVATYVREIPVSLDRMYENALDGEHLPYLHSSTFSYLDILDAGSWGWRARVGMQPRSRLTDMEIELVLNREEFCWKTRTLKGLGKGTEIWTHAIPLDDRRIRVVVDFYVPKLPPMLKSMYADYYLSVYQQLYDEDEMMMTQRQDALDLRQRSGRREDGRREDGRRDAPQRHLLGAVSDVLRRIPFTVELNDQLYCVNQVQGQPVAYAAHCPHMLAPLEQVPVVDGILECPWHAYRFDVRSGACVSGQSCRMKPAPTIEVDAGSGEAYLVPL